MHFPEQLYAMPFLKDRYGQQIEAVIRSLNLQLLATNTVSGEILRVPSDRIFILTSVAVQFAADALGGVMTGCACYATIDGGGQNWLMATNNSGSTLAAGQPAIAYGSTGSVFVTPGARVYVNVTANTSATHTAVVTITGLSIPRGNIAVS